MTFVPKLPHKVQYLSEFSFSFISKLCEKSIIEKFVGGRPGYDKELLFFLLLMKRLTNWSFRTIAEMGGISHSTLVFANTYFLVNHVYEKFFLYLVKKAYHKGLIKGRFVAMDSSFIETFSGKQEEGSEGWNGFKEAYGFKLHLLIDCETKFPIALTVTNGLASDNTLAIPLLKRAKNWLKKVGYVLADKGYDDGEIVDFIVKAFSAKAGIPIRKVNRGKNYSWKGATRNFQLKAKGRTLKKSIYNRRTAVERVFSVLKRVFHLGKEEVRGILSFAKQAYLTLICYMLSLFDIAKSI
ncbi:MAG: Transposase IS4 family protein [Candidatus Levybacteria bacterium GW2011_GWB1_35_5]|nr:MAG: Transposase IS4 family protein [Candidatus Levybacteria bacterium GW2011_GWB1_35_5]